MKSLSILILTCISLLGFAQTAPEKFHDTKGNIKVNGAGQLQFSLSIALPPGIKPVASQANFYTSDSNNGISGYGWNLSGLIAITRTEKLLKGIERLRQYN